LNAAYHDTVAALAGALESKDTGTRAHSQRVQLYAVELAGAFAPELLEDPSVEYGFLLHDVGKVGIPDGVLPNPAPLSPPQPAVGRSGRRDRRQVGQAVRSGCGRRLPRARRRVARNTRGDRLTRN